MALADLASAAAGRSYPMPEIRGGSQEELPKSEVRGRSRNQNSLNLELKSQLSYESSLNVEKGRLSTIWAFNLLQLLNILLF